MGFLLGGPIVHWAHCHLDRGFESLGLNVGLSLAGAITRSLMPSTSSTSAPAVSTFAGSPGAGFVVAEASRCVGAPLIQVSTEPAERLESAPGATAVTVRCP